MSESELKAAITEILKHDTILLIIDDIDTLTTKGEEAGSDFLFKEIVRSGNESRILYTARNKPIQSLANAIEITGLDLVVEFPEFVETSCRHFKVQPPNDNQLKEIYQTSSGIPLIVETIIGLRRTAGSWDAAIKYFVERGGAEARSYLFRREYDALPSNRSRYLLAALSIFRKPVTRSDLRSVLNYSDEQIQQAIGEVLELFLTVQNDETGEDRYSLNEITKAFVLDVAPSLEKYPTTQERVKNYVANVLPKPNQELARLEFEMDQRESKGEYNEAWQLISKHFAPKIIEDPRFKSLKARIGARCTPPKTTEVRDLLTDCIAFGHVIPEAMRAWIEMERHVGHGFVNILKACDAVLVAPNATEKIKAEFLARKAFAQLERVEEERTTNLEDAFNRCLEAMKLNMLSYAKYSKLQEVSTRNFIYCARNFHLLAHLSTQVGGEKDIFSLLEELSKVEDVCFDPLNEELRRYFLFLARSCTPENNQRRQGLIRRFEARLRDGAYECDDREGSRALIETCVRALSQLKEAR